MGLSSRDLDANAETDTIGLVIVVYVFHSHVTNLQASYYRTDGYLANRNLIKVAFCKFYKVKFHEFGLVIMAMKIQDGCQNSRLLQK